MLQEPLKALLPKFIASLKELKRSPSTVLAYRSDITQLVSYLEQKNKVTPGQAVQSDIEEFRDWLLASKYTPKSASRKLNAVKTFYRWLKDEGIIETDPTKDVTHPEIKTSKPKFLSELEYRALRDVVRSDERTATMVEIILQTGMRISEIANLKIENIKKDSLVIEAYATQPQRETPLNQAARAAINSYLTGRPKSESEYLFVSKNGNRLAVRNIRAAVDRYMQKAQIPDYSVNDLRTTFIVENLKRGVSLPTIQQAAGHKRLSTTERYLELAQVKESGKKSELEEL